jgi:uncharacterized membrane protein YhhN
VSFETPFVPASIGITGVFVFGLLVAEYRASDLGRWIAKPLASASFVVFAIGCGALHSAYGRTVLLALALSFFGDVLLIPKNMVVFRIGVASFLAAHIALAVAFVNVGVAAKSLFVSAIPIFAISGFVASRILPHVPKDLRGAVVAYVVVISAMLTCATSCALHVSFALIFVAALAFYISDLSVARDKFIAPGFINRAWGLPLYYAAQLALAWSVVGIANA